MKGLFLGETGKYEEAIICFDKTLELNPDFEDAAIYKEKALKAQAGQEEWTSELTETEEQ